jgi:hypothetical protein
MYRHSLLFLLITLSIIVSACGPTPEEQATQTATAQTATAFSWTPTDTSTNTPTETPSLTFTTTNTFTPSITETPSITLTPTISLTPTFDFPKVRVNVDALACRYGPSTAHLWHYTLVRGDTGVVWGRHRNSVWLYVKMDTTRDACWAHPYYLDIEGDITRMLYQEVRLPMTNALYAAPENVEAVRNEDEVTVTWDEVWMTEDDDRGYFLDVFVCQDGSYLWMPTSLENQYQTSVTFVDEPGCPYPSGGKLYTVEKHGYPDPVIIPWPPAK